MDVRMQDYLTDKPKYFQTVASINYNIEELREKYFSLCSYKNRLGPGFLIKFDLWLKHYGEDHHILSELDCLEANETTTTKPEKQFKSNLAPFWHKHFYASDAMMQNIGNYWQISNGSSRSYELDALFEDAFDRFGEDLKSMSNYLAHSFMGGLEKRSEQNKLTGHWIIYHKIGHERYYLSISNHVSGENELIERKFIFDANSHYFPFLNQISK
jgi:hypothetical protein